MMMSSGARSAKGYGTVTKPADYVWGAEVSLSALQPGDVVQMRDYRFDREVDVNKAAAMFIEAAIALVSQRLLSTTESGPVEDDARLVTEVFLHGLAEESKRKSK